jgi:hypothetical protein
MEFLDGIGVVAAVEDAAGNARFLDDLTPLALATPGMSETLKFWRFEGDAVVPEAVGGVPAVNAFTGPGGAMFAIICFPPHARKLTKEELLKANPTLRFDESDDPEMHCTDTIDLGFIVSGRTDLKLPGGERRTLEAGTAFVVAGARHAWENPYDEPCIFTNVGVGVRRASASGGSG